MGLLSTLSAASARAYGFTRSAVAAAVDEYFNRTTLLLNTSSTNGAQNNTFLDSSTNNFTITRNGNTTQGTFTPFSQTGWSNYFNGSSDYLLPASGSDFTLGTGDFSISMWIYPTTSATSTTGFFGIGGATTGQIGLFTKFASNGDNTLVINTTNITTLVTTGVFNVNSWNHVALSRASGTLSVYLNGTRVANSSFTDNLSQTEPCIGRTYYNLSQEYFTGYISDVRVVKGTALYSGTTITVPTTFSTDVTNTKLLTCKSNRFVDVNTQVTAKSITVGGTPRVQAFSPFAPTAAYDTAVVGGSGYFDGSGDYLSIANSTAFDFGSGDFTVEFWMNLNSSGDQNVIGKWWTGGGQWVIQYRAAGSDSRASQHIRVAWNSSSTADFDFTIPLNSWNHFAIVKSSGTLYVFLNGVRNATTATIGSLTATTDVLTIGQFGNASTGYINGYLSGIRITKGGALYTTSTFTVPTAPPTTTVSAGTVSGLLNYTNTGIYDSTAKNVLETVGNAQVSTTQAKWGTTSMYFDGTGDYLVTPNIYTGDFLSGDFTIEYWFRCGTQSTSYLPQIGTLDSGTGNYSWRFGTQLGASAGVYFAYHNGSGFTDVTFTTTNYNDNTWHHAALTRSNGTVRAFIDGTQVGSNQTITTSFTARRVVVGAELLTPSYYTGYLDDLRITKYARYVSNFSVPTAAFGTQ